MSNIDPTFLWETEALRERRTAARSSTMAVTGSVAVATAEATGDELAGAEQGFVSLAAASEVTGIPINTLRKWSRRGAVVSYLDETADQPVRMVSLDAVRSRAASLGREISALAAAPSARPRTPEPRVTVDLTERPVAPAVSPGAAVVAAEEDAAPPATPSGSPAARDDVSDHSTIGPAPARREAAAVAPPGTMIVPISAWEKMLNQLGNLHEAGRDMAEARERAARAETEAVFLRERLKELRAELAIARDLPAVTPIPAVTPMPAASDRPGLQSEASTPAPPDPAPAPREPFEDFLRRAYRSLKKRLQG